MRNSTFLAPWRLAAMAWILPLASAGAYEVVRADGSATKVDSLAFSGERAILGTDKGAITTDASGLDYYETFRRNLGHGGGNVIVFTTGALLRFDSLDIKDGTVGVKVAGGAGFTVPESLVDFQASVREGAMVRLPESAGRPASVSRSGSSDGGFVPEPADAPQVEPEPTEEVAAGGRVRPGRAAFGSRRGASGLRDRRSAAAAERGEEPDPELLTPPEGEPGSEFDPNDPRLRDGNPLPDEEGEQVPVTAGQSVLVVTTTFNGEIGGLQAEVSFPTSLRIVEPVMFSGFASALPQPTVNTRIPGRLHIISVANPNPDGGILAGGEFLRLTFTWTGRPPALQQFSVSVKATDALTGATINDFPKELSLF